MITSRAADPQPPAWRPLMSAEQHRRQAALLRQRGGKENGALALHHEQIAKMIEHRLGTTPATAH